MYEDNSWDFQHFPITLWNRVLTGSICLEILIFRSHFFVFYVIISSHTFKILNSHFSQYSREKIFYQNISNY